MPQPILIRRNATLEVTRAEGDAAPVVRMTVSSEAPVMTWARYNGQYQQVYEILGHGPGECDLSRVADGLPILDGHYSDQVAVIREPQVGDGRLGGSVEWCAGDRAENLARDCAEKKRRGASIEAIGQPDSYTLVGEKNGIPVVRLTRWQPTAAALVAVPADWTVGVDRAQKYPQSIPEITIERTIAMPEPVTPPAEPAKQAAPAVTPPAAPPAQSASDFVRMLTLAKTHDVPIGELNEYVSRGATLDEFRDHVMARLARGAKTRPVGSAEVDLSRKEAKRYNVINVIRSMLGIGSPDITFEREVSAEIARKMQREATGFYLPMQFLRENAPVNIARAESGSVANASLIETEVGTMLDILRPRLLAGRLNYTVMGGLVGNVSIPKDSQAAAYYWVGESTDVSQQTVAAGQVPLTPHTVGVFADLSKQLLAQGSYDVQSWVINKLMANIAQGMDAALIQGTGVDGQPKGIINATGVNTPSVSTPGTPSYAECLGFFDAIEDDNADAEAMRWLLRPDVRSQMAVTDLSTGAGLPFLDLRSKTAGGYPYVVSTVGPENSALFGDFSRAILGLWGAVDLNIDRSTLSKSGGTRLVALAMCDVAVTYGEAFAYSASMDS